MLGCNDSHRRPWTQCFKVAIAIAAVLAFGIATAASASAKSFLASAKEKLLSTKVAKQVFTTEAGTSECGKAAITAGESSTTETTEQTATIQYEECRSFGFVETTFSPVEYDFEADGEVEILKTISIKAIGCEISVPPQSVNSIDYQTAGSNLLLEPLVTGILYTATGSTCAKTGEFKNGTYKGHSEAMIAGGTLSFMASGQTGPLLSSSNPLSFGFVTLSTSREKTITFTADELLKIEKTIKAPAAPFGAGKTNTCNGALLAAKGTCQYSVTFSPGSMQVEFGLLSFEYEVASDNQLLSETLILKGRGD